ncbi:MAG TPA: hypothetical protein VFR39_08555 [Burkholderiales bacterium]|nr:hypothetical protein [Burkholderiales bacterium]
MRKTLSRLPAAIVLAAFAGGSVISAHDALAQKPIVCWKDKSGKTVGCGDSVPPEFQDSATRELDQRGITRKTTDTAEERARRAAQEKETAAQKAAERKRAAEQSRQDDALMNTFTDEKEIDLKRDRDLQVAESQLTQLKVAHKNATDREKDFKGRIEAATKEKKPVSEYQKEELARAHADIDRFAQGIKDKEKEMAEIRKRYADMRQRYILLKGGTSAPAASAAPAAPAKTASPAKK